MASDPEGYPLTILVVDARFATRERADPSRMKMALGQRGHPELAMSARPLWATSAVGWQPISAKWNKEESLLRDTRR